MENAKKLCSTVASLSASWTIPDLKEDFESLKSRFDMIKVTISEVETALPFMHKCFEYQPTLLEVLTWVQELILTLETEFTADSVDQINEELNRHKVNFICYLVFPIF